ncbi:MAG: hypothetical protein RSB67_04455 [Clostridia bacterium]
MVEQVKNINKEDKKIRNKNRTSIPKRNKNKNGSKLFDILKNYYSFYRENLKKKHIVLYVIILILFFIFLSILLSQVNFDTILKEVGKNTMDNNSIFSMIKEKIFIIFLIVFAGITPYVYIPVIGVLSSYTFALSIVSVFGVNNSTFNLVFMCIGAIMQIFGFALAISTGIYYCKISTKKFKYSQSRSFGINDVKKAVYEIRKNNAKVEKIEKLQKEKIENQNKLNVKVPYSKLVISFVISLSIVLIGTLVARI